MTKIALYKKFGKQLYTSQAVSVSSPVKIRLWLYYIWLCTKIYGSARKSYLQMLDPIHNQGLRLALGAFRIFPVASLNVEADEPSLYSRRQLFETLEEKK